MWPSPGPGPDSKCSKTLEVGCSSSELKPEIATDEIQKEENYVERSNIQSARVSALTGSVHRKMAEGRQRVSAPSGNGTRAARLPATHLNH